MPNALERCLCSFSLTAFMIIVMGPMMMILWIGIPDLNINLHLSEVEERRWGVEVGVSACVCVLLCACCQGQLHWPLDASLLYRLCYAE